MNYVDPTGNWIETAFDAYMFAEYIATPSLMNGIAVILDAICVIVPGLPGGAGLILREVVHMSPKWWGYLKSALNTKIYNKILDFVKTNKKALQKEAGIAENVMKTTSDSVSINGASIPIGSSGSSSVGTGACFVAGNPILTENGHKNIEDIQVGDVVYSEDPETGQRALKRVVRTFIHEKETLRYVYVDGTKIETTEEHPFWVIGK